MAMIFHVTHVQKQVVRYYQDEFVSENTAPLGVIKHFEELLRHVDMDWEYIKEAGGFETLNRFMNQFISKWCEDSFYMYENVLRRFKMKELLEKIEDKLRKLRDSFRISPEEQAVLLCQDDIIAKQNLNVDFAFGLPKGFDFIRIWEQASVGEANRRMLKHLLDTWTLDSYDFYMTSLLETGQVPLYTRLRKVYTACLERNIFNVLSGYIIKTQILDSHLLALLVEADILTVYKKTIFEDEFNKNKRNDMFVSHVINNWELNTYYRYTKALASHVAKRNNDNSSLIVKLREERKKLPVPELGNVEEPAVTIASPSWVRDGPLQLSTRQTLTSIQHSMPADVYPIEMSKMRRGRVLCIHYTSRPADLQDFKALEELFTSDALHCHFVDLPNFRKDDLTLRLHYEAGLDVTGAGEALPDVGITFLRGDLEQLDFLIVIVMAHGSEGVFQTLDDQPFLIQDLVNIFDCPKLRGKPKCFFIQACQAEPRGQSVAERSSRVERPGGRSRHTSGDATGKPSVWKQISGRADMLISCVHPGLYASGYPHYGSLFIQALCKTFAEKLAQKHVLELTAKINGIIYQESLRKKQVDMLLLTSHTLTKDFFLCPDAQIE